MKMFEKVDVWASFYLSTQEIALSSWVCIYNTRIVCFLERSLLSLNSTVPHKTALGLSIRKYHKFEVLYGLYTLVHIAIRKTVHKNHSTTSIVTKLYSSNVKCLAIVFLIKFNSSTNYI